MNENACDIFPNDEKNPTFAFTSNQSSQTSIGGRKKKSTETWKKKQSLHKLWTSENVKQEEKKKEPKENKAFQ